MRSIHSVALVLAVLAGADWAFAQGETEVRRAGGGTVLPVGPPIPL